MKAVHICSYVYFVKQKTFTLHKNAFIYEVYMTAFLFSS